VATAPGRGGIGVVRVSGPNIEPIAQAVLGAAVAQRLKPREATLARFWAADGSQIDQGIALWFAAPRSYTGEHVLELQGHGGPVVLRMLAARCVAAGRTVHARYAQPGEFTQRAFISGQLDLAQAEAVADLIDAATEAAARSAVRSLAGVFSERVHALADRLIELRTLVEATLDFPDEDIELLQSSDARTRLAAIEGALDALLAQARQGSILREGLHVVLVGAPNVGKSSVLNRLAGEEVAIVTPVAGTTRDRIVHQISLDGIPLHVIDTAGLRDTTDEIEQLGMVRTLKEVARADVVLHLTDEAAPADDAAVLARVQAHIGAGVPILHVVNKIDLTGSAPGRYEGTVRMSAATGAGVEALHQALLDVAGWSHAHTADTAVLARQRHIDALLKAREHLAAAVTVSHASADFGDAQLELFAEELRLAGNALGEITGEVSADELLGHIFSRFCIGK